MDPYEYAFKCFGGKWKTLILHGIYVDKVARFSTFKKHFSISEKVLSQILKGLEADGLVKRSVFPEVTVRVEYELTSSGESLIVLMHQIYNWSRKEMLEKDIPIDSEGEKWHGYVNDPHLHG
jgi:DNA-binding HxlR family transcriptional regulator